MPPKKSLPEGKEGDELPRFGRVKNNLKMGIVGLPKYGLPLFTTALCSLHQPITEVVLLSTCITLQHEGCARPYAAGAHPCQCPLHNPMDPHCLGFSQRVSLPHSRLRSLSHSFRLATQSSFDHSPSPHRALRTFHPHTLTPPFAPTRSVGKSSLFNLLGDNADAAAENFPFCTIDPNDTRCAVPDKRYKQLCDIWEPPSKYPAFLHLVDIAGLIKGAAEGAGLGNAFLSHVRTNKGRAYLVCVFGLGCLLAPSPFTLSLSHTHTVFLRPFTYTHPHTHTLLSFRFRRWTVSITSCGASTTTRSDRQTDRLTDRLMRQAPLAALSRTLLRQTREEAASCGTMLLQIRGCFI